MINSSIDLQVLSNSGQTDCDSDIVLDQRSAEIAHASIDDLFDAIHNGPLQTLACLLRTIQNTSLPLDHLYSELNGLNAELRSICQMAQRKAATSEYINRDLTRPLHELLYEVYCSTLERNFPCFHSITLKVTDFREIDQRSLTLEQKQSLCRFLEEALCNVGKYAIKATRLDVACGHYQGQNFIRITDNGPGISNSLRHPPEGHGTQQAQKLAQQIKGTFRRSTNLPNGTCCQLVWPSL